MDEVEDNLDIYMKYANHDDHVPSIEQNNRVVRERFIIAYHSTPYKKISKLMIKHLAMIFTTQLNLFTDKGGFLAYCSHHMIPNQRIWDCKKHCQYEFGSYFHTSQVNKSKKNLACNVDAIYLRPTTNLQGGQKLMDIATWILITLPKVYPCVMTKTFIKAVEKIAESQGFKTLKNITRRRKLIFMMLI